MADALQDVSGGVAETINVQKFLAGNFGGDPTDGATRMANNNNSHSGASNNTNSNSKAAVTADAMARLFRMLRAAFDQQALIVAAIAVNFLDWRRNFLEVEILKNWISTGSYALEFVGFRRRIRRMWRRVFRVGW